MDPVTAHLSSQDNVTYTVMDKIYEEIVVEKNDIVLDGKGSTLEGTGIGTGVHLSKVNNVTIQNLEITNFQWGIWLDSSFHP